MTGTIHTADEVRALIREACERAGSQAEFAEQIGISRPYLSLILSGKREPTDMVTRAIGLKRHVYYTASA